MYTNDSNEKKCYASVTLTTVYSLIFFRRKVDEKNKKSYEEQHDTCPNTHHSKF